MKNIVIYFKYAEYVSQRVTISLSSNDRCKLCKIYVQECESFQTADKRIWHIKSNITYNT